MHNPTEIHDNSIKYYQNEQNNRSYIIIKKLTAEVLTGTRTLYRPSLPSSLSQKRMLHDHVQMTLCCLEHRSRQPSESLNLKKIYQYSNKYTYICIHTYTYTNICHQFESQGRDQDSYGLINSLPNNFRSVSEISIEKKH